MTETKKKFSIPRMPGDIMIYPMIIGILINTFCPQILDIGGFWTAVSRQGANPIVAVILFAIGSGIDVRSTPAALKTGLAITLPKLVVAIAIGLATAFFLNDNLLGLSSVSIIGGITFCNIALFTGIMAEHGNEAEQGSVGVLCLTVGPVITMLALGVAGLADIPFLTLIGCILPLVLGMIAGAVSPFMRNILGQSQTALIMVIGFELGCTMSLQTFLTGGISGVFLAVLTLLVGLASIACERLLGGTGRAGAACATIAGTAMTTPAALALVGEYYAQIQPAATAQIAVAVIITALIAPIATAGRRTHGGAKSAKVEAAI